MERECRTSFCWFIFPILLLLSIILLQGSFENSLRNNVCVLICFWWISLRDTTEWELNLNMSATIFQSILLSSNTFVFQLNRETRALTAHLTQHVFVLHNTPHFHLGNGATHMESNLPEKKRRNSFFGFMIYIVGVWCQRQLPFPNAWFAMMLPEWCGNGSNLFFWRFSELPSMSATKSRQQRIYVLTFFSHDTGQLWLRWVSVALRAFGMQKCYTRNVCTYSDRCGISYIIYYAFGVQMAYTLR